MSNDETTQASAAHTAYMAQVRQLVDTDTDALFGQLTTVLARARGYEPAARQAEVSRQGQTLTVTNGPCRVVLTVEAIGDLPNGTDRARLFPTGQARCLVHAPDGSTVEWLLRRDHWSDGAPVYTWMVAGSDTHVGEPEMNTALRPLLACQGSIDAPTRAGERDTDHSRLAAATAS